MMTLCLSICPPKGFVPAHINTDLKFTLDVIRKLTSVRPLISDYAMFTISVTDCRVGLPFRTYCQAPGKSSSQAIWGHRANQLLQQSMHCALHAANLNEQRDGIYLQVNSCILNLDFSQYL